MTATAAAAPPPGGGEGQLVALVRPAGDSALERPGQPVTLGYDVLEVFEGEPDGPTVQVRHDRLEAADRERLLAGESVILLANRDPSRAGHWVAPAPVAATDEAIAAFRSWSAPDPPPARSAAPAPVAAPVPPVRERAVQAPEEERVGVRTETAAALARPEPRRVVAEAPMDTGRDRPAPPVALGDPPAPKRATPAAVASAPRGPGLPPPPEPTTLGPPLGARVDLRQPRTRRGEPPLPLPPR